MSRQDLIRSVSKRTGLKQSDAAAAVEAFLAAVQEALLQGQKVSLRGFGTFSLLLQRPRIARNLTTGETIQLPARLRVTFTPARHLQDAIRKNPQLLRRFVEGN